MDVRAAVHDLAPESVRDLVTDLETAWADRGTKRRPYPPRLRAALQHRRYPSTCNIAYNPAPSGMKRSDDIASRIVQQYGDAIGGKNPEQQTRFGGHLPVSFDEFAGRVPIASNHEILVNLVQS